MCAGFERDCELTAFGYCNFKYSQLAQQLACEAKLGECCPHFSTSCDVGGGLDCLMAASLTA